MASWMDVIRKVAPTLGGMLPGPLGNMARGALSTALGVDADDKSLEKKVASLTADDLLKLKQAEQTFAAQMKQMDIDVLRIGAEDSANARAMQVSTRSWVPACLALFIHLMLAGMLVALFTKAVPESNRTAFDIVLGIVGSGVAAVWSFYFGSSASSHLKDETLARVTSNGK